MTRADSTQKLLPRTGAFVLMLIVLVLDLGSKQW